MEYFWITKTDKTYTLEKELSLNDGYMFHQTLNITLYNNDIISYILTKKINNSLKKLINIFLLLDEDDDEDARENLSIKIETLRNLIIQKYRLYIDNADDYLKKLDKLEKKVNSKNNKKTKHR